MRLAEKRRREEAEQQGLTTGIEWCLMKGNNLPGQRYEIFNSEATGHLFTCSLFADDTTLLGEEKEMEMAVPLTKEIMMSFEEKNNDGKEERMVFGGGEEEKTRMLGCWLGAAEDIKQRTARAGNTWFKIKKQLTRSQLPKTTQARIIQACVENALLFDCNTCVVQERC